MVYSGGCSLGALYDESKEFLGASANEAFRVALDPVAQPFSHRRLRVCREKGAAGHDSIARWTRAPFRSPLSPAPSSL